MRIENTYIKGLNVLYFDKFQDNRGSFSVLSNSKILELLGFDDNFQQDNYSFNEKKFTIRGLHYQLHPFSQSKLVYCLSGEILDVVVDLRKDSKTYLKTFKINLSGNDSKALFIPKGCAHGFQTLLDNSIVFYKVDNIYNPKFERTINYNHESIDIQWPHTVTEISNKDKIQSDKIDIFYKKILIMGSHGQLGRSLYNYLSCNNYICLGMGKKDFENLEIAKKKISDFSPDIIINCAAITNVDYAQSNPEETFHTNYILSKEITDFANRNNIKYIFISTDYVFESSNEEIDIHNYKKPLNYYGFSKSLAEDYILKTCSNHVIIRTAWLYGKGDNNFVEKVIKKIDKGVEFFVVTNEVGSPTFVEDLNKSIKYIIQNDIHGIVHTTNEGYCSRYDFSRTIAQKYGKGIDLIKPIKGEKSIRPQKVILKNNLPIKLRNWKEALDEYMKRRLL